MEIKIKSKKIENKIIYGNFLENKNTTTIVIFLSGLSGNDAQSLVKNASLFFFKNKFSTLSFNFCNDDKFKNYKTNSPKIENMSLLVYIGELRNIIDTVCKKYTKIVLIGHSFGAIVLILFLNTYLKYINKTKLVLWDPSILPWSKQDLEDTFVFIPKEKLYFQKGIKKPMIINKTFYQELMRTKNTVSILKSLNKEVCIIGAAKGAEEDSKKYFLKLKNKKSSTIFIIKNAKHTFNGKNTREKLFNKTMDFLNNETPEK